MENGSEYERRLRLKLQAVLRPWPRFAFLQRSLISARLFFGSTKLGIPMWAMAGSSALGITLLVNHLMLIDPAVASAQTDMQITGDQSEAYALGEVVIYNPSEETMSKLSNLGYSMIEKLELDQSDLVVMHLKIPDNMNVLQAIADLRSRFPSLEVDVNHTFNVAGES